MLQKVLLSSLLQERFTFIIKIKYLQTFYCNATFRLIKTTRHRIIYSSQYSLEHRLL